MKVCRNQSPVPFRGCQGACPCSIHVCVFRGPPTPGTRPVKHCIMRTWTKATFFQTGRQRYHRRAAQITDECDSTCPAVVWPRRRSKGWGGTPPGHYSLDGIRCRRPQPPHLLPRHRRRPTRSWAAAEGRRERPRAERLGQARRRSERIRYDKQTYIFEFGCEGRSRYYK